MKRDTEETISKKKAVNIKAEAAKARKNAAEAERKNREAREKEDQKWRDAEGGPKSRVAKKREEEAEKRAEAVARKAAARRFAEQEEKDLEKSLKKPAAKKVTEAELRERKEEQQAVVQQKVEEEKLKRSRVAVEEEYQKMILVSNTNRRDDGLVLEANTIDEAIAKLTNAKEDNLPVMIKKQQERKIKATQERKKGNSDKLISLGQDDQERSLLRDVRRINLDKSCLDDCNDYSVEDAEEFEDSYEDDYHDYEDKYYDYY